MKFASYQTAEDIRSSYPFSFDPYGLFLCSSSLYDFEQFCYIIVKIEKKRKATPHTAALGAAILGVVAAEMM